MIICIFINSKTLGKIFKRLQLTSRGKLEIIQAVKTRFSTKSIFNRFTREIEFK